MINCVQSDRHLTTLAKCALLLGRVDRVKGVAACIVIKLSRGRSVGLCVDASVCPVHCGKMADRIRMPFGVIGRTGLGMRQIVGFGDRSTGRSTFGGHLWRPIVTNGDFTA